MQLFDLHVLKWFVQGEPGSGHIPQDEALEIAIEEFLRGGKLTKEEILDQYSIEPKFNMANPDSPQWWVEFEPKNSSEPVGLNKSNVCLDATTGEVIFVVTTSKVNFSIPQGE